MKKHPFVKTAFALAFALVFSPLPSAAQQARTDAAPSTQAAMSYFVIVYEPGQRWKRGEPLASQGLEAHGRYMRQLAQDDILILAGPLSTIEGGLVILMAQSLDEANEIMEKDPAVIEGKFTGRVSMWRPVIDPKTLLPPEMSSQR